MVTTVNALFSRRIKFPFHDILNWELGDNRVDTHCTVEKVVEQWGGVNMGPNDNSMPGAP